MNLDNKENKQNQEYLFRLHLAFPERSLYGRWEGTETGEVEVYNNGRWTDLTYQEFAHLLGHDPKSPKSTEIRVALTQHYRGVSRLRPPPT